MATSDFNGQSNGLVTKSNCTEQNSMEFRTLEQIMGIWVERYKKAIVRPGAAILDRVDGLSIKGATDLSSFGPFIFDAEDARGVAREMSEKEVRRARASVLRLAQMDSSQLAALQVADPAAFAKNDDEIANLISHASALKAFSEEVSARKAAVTR